MDGAFEGSTRKKKSTAEGLRRLRIGDAIQSLALVLPTNVIKKEKYSYIDVLKTAVRYISATKKEKDGDKISLLEQTVKQLQERCEFYARLIAQNGIDVSVVTYSKRLSTFQNVEVQTENNQPTPLGPFLLVIDPSPKTEDHRPLKRFPRTNAPPVFRSALNLPPIRPKETKTGAEDHAAKSEEEIVSVQNHEDPIFVDLDAVSSSVCNNSHNFVLDPADVQPVDTIENFGDFRSSMSKEVEVQTEIIGRTIPALAVDGTITVDQATSPMLMEPFPESPSKNATLNQAVVRKRRTVRQKTDKATKSEKQKRLKKDMKKKQNEQHIFSVDTNFNPTCQSVPSCQAVSDAIFSGSKLWPEKPRVKRKVDDKTSKPLLRVEDILQREKSPTQNNNIVKSTASGTSQSDVIAKPKNPYLHNNYANEFNFQQQSCYNYSNGNDIDGDNANQTVTSIWTDFLPNFSSMGQSDVNCQLNLTTNQSNSNYFTNDPNYSCSQLRQSDSAAKFTVESLRNDPENGANFLKTPSRHKVSPKIVAQNNATTKNFDFHPVEKSNGAYSSMPLFFPSISSSAGQQNNNEKSYNNNNGNEISNVNLSNSIFDEQQRTNPNPLFRPDGNLLYMPPPLCDSATKNAAFSSMNYAGNTAVRPSDIRNNLENSVDRNYTRQLSQQPQPHAKSLQSTNVRLKAQNFQIASMIPDQSTSENSVTLAPSASQSSSGYNQIITHGSQNFWNDINGHRQSQTYFPYNRSGHTDQTTIRNNNDSTYWNNHSQIISNNQSYDISGQNNNNNANDPCQNFMPSFNFS